MTKWKKKKQKKKKRENVKGMTRRKS